MCTTTTASRILPTPLLPSCCEPRPNWPGMDVDCYIEKRASSTFPLGTLKIISDGVRVCFARRKREQSVPVAAIGVTWNYTPRLPTFHLQKQFNGTDRAFDLSFV